MFGRCWGSSASFCFREWKLPHGHYNRSKSCVCKVLEICQWPHTGVCEAILAKVSSKAEVSGDLKCLFVRFVHQLIGNEEGSSRKGAFVDWIPGIFLKSLKSLKPSRKWLVSLVKTLGTLKSKKQNLLKMSFPKNPFSKRPLFPTLKFTMSSSPKLTHAFQNHVSLVSSFRGWELPFSKPLHSKNRKPLIHFCDCNCRTFKKKLRRILSCNCILLRRRAKL